MKTILIVDDDPHIQELIAIHMNRAGFQCLNAGDGEQALEQLQTQTVHLVVLDVMMPKLNGFEVCEAIRTMDTVPVLMLTAKGEIHHKVKGFEAGVDDYLLKPFEPQELLIRVKALLRRSHQHSDAVLTIGNLTIDPREHSVKVGAQVETLPPKEFGLLYLLASYPRQIFTREQLIAKLWGDDYEGGNRTVDVHVKRLRERLESWDDDCKITTIRGLGYRLEEKS